MQKRVHITYTAIPSYFLFLLRYQQQVLNCMRTGTVWILLPYHFTWVNEPLNTARKTPLPKRNFLWYGVKFVISDIQCIIVLRETYKFQIRKYKPWHGVNECMPSVRYLFLRKRRTKVKCVNMFVGKVTQFQNNSQWARSVTTLIVTVWCNYCTINAKNGSCSSSIYSSNKINSEYKLYKLCELLGATNYSSTS